MKLRRFYALDPGERKSCAGVFDGDRVHRASGPWLRSVIVAGVPEGVSPVVSSEVAEVSTGGIGRLRNPVTAGSAQ